MAAVGDIGKAAPNEEEGGAGREPTLDMASSATLTHTTTL